MVFGPVRFDVPATWPVRDAAADPSLCVRFDRSAVYLGAQGPDARCPARAIGRADSVQVEPAVPDDEPLGPPRTTAGGLVYRIVSGTEADALIVARFESPGVQVTLAHRRDPAGALRILDSFAPASHGAAPLAPVRSVERPGAPATPSLQGYGGSIFDGLGFDACAAPSEASMTAWLASPYRMLGIYIGGANRGCAQPNLTRTWVADVEAMGWRFIPTYVGLQAPCAKHQGFDSIDPEKAEDQGIAAADDVAGEVAALGLGEGAPVYFDMEGYDNTDQACDLVVERFLSAYVGEMHAKHLAAGVYGGAASTIAELVRNYDDKTHHRPDDIWIGHWDGRQDVFGDPYAPDTMWAVHQRLHQYQGGHDETWGGVTINVDNDVADGNVVGPRRDLVYDGNASGSREIYVVGPDGFGLRRLTHNTADDYGPAVSRDGTKIAWSSNVSGHYNLWVMNADGTGAKQITFDTHVNAYPSWSPSGTQLVFQSTRTGHTNLWIVNADGTGLRQLTSTSYADTRPAWSPGGSTVAFTSTRSGNNDVWTISTSGQYLRRLTWKSGADEDPAWAPDGSLLAFDSDRTGNPEIFTITPKGQGAAQVTNDAATDMAAGWSADAKRVAFTSDRGGVTQVFVMDRDGTNEVQLTFGGGMNQLPSWI